MRAARAHSAETGARLLKLAGYVFSSGLVEGVLRPTIEDLKFEHTEARVGQESHRVMARGYFSFWLTVLSQLPKTLARELISMWNTLLLVLASWQWKTQSCESLVYGIKSFTPRERVLTEIDEKAIDDVQSAIWHPVAAAILALGILMLGVGIEEGGYVAFGVGREFDKLSAY